MLISVCLSLRPSREGQEAGIYICWTLVQALVCDLEAVHPSYNNDMIDSRNMFHENPNSQKTGFLRIGEVEPSRIATMLRQTGSGHGSTYMR